MNNRTRDINTAFHRLSVCLGAVALSFVTVAAAGSAERQLGTHVHGVGRLDVAIEDQMVELQLHSPGADIVGFEHDAETAEDKATLSAAIAALKDGSKLFLFSAGAGCRLADVDVTLVEEGHDEHKSPDDEAAHTEKDHDDHDEHEHDGHTEFQAHYRFHCDHADQVTHIDVKFFERFPAARELDVQTISSRGQGAVELTPASARLDL